MFIKKTPAEFNALTEEEQIKYLKEKEANDKEVVKAQIEEATKNFVTKEKYEELEKANKLQGEVITELKEKSTLIADSKKTLADEVLEKKEELKSLVKGAGKEVTLKTATTRASITDSNSQLVLGGITQLGVKKRSLYNLFRKVQVGNGNHAGKITYTDWDEATIARASEFVAEGGTFPESTASFRSYSVELKKIGDTLPVSEEFGEDEVSASAELDMFLRVNMETKIDDALVNADGTANSILGLKESVPTYTPVASGIPSPNIYDLTKKVKTAITFNRGSKYSPDFVVFNDNTADKLHLEKDKNDNYIFPDKMNIGAINIFIDNNFADNEMVVGDSRYATIYEKSGVTLERVYVNAQPIEDMVTLKARARMLFLIKNGDKTGFLKVDDIDAALVTLATAV